MLVLLLPHCCAYHTYIVSVAFLDVLWVHIRVCRRVFIRVHVRFVCLCTRYMRTQTYAGELSSDCFFIWLSVSLPAFYWHFFRLLFMKILNWRILRMASCLWLVCNLWHYPYFCLATDYAEPIAIERNTRHSGMWKLIGCALSDRDIDHNSKVLNAFYLFIGYIHFVCLKHT